MPSKLNPADSASRGLEACSLDTVKWLKGPEFLLRSESEWPELNTSFPELPPELLEDKGKVEVFSICEPSVCVFERLISRCFNIYKLKRVMAWILRYVSVIRSCLEREPVSFDDHNIESLTSNHIPLFQGNPNLPPGLFQESDSYARQRWAQIQYLSNQFWRRWVSEILPNLTQRQNWFQATKNFQVDDVVLLVENMQ